MPRKVFFSFHFDGDCWRTNQVRNAGVVEGEQPVSGNAWEAVKKGGDAAIQKWINDQLVGKSCAVVLIGSATAGRPWIDYEIKQAWNTQKGLVGIYVHNLEDANSRQSTKGSNPFAGFTLKEGKESLAGVVKTYDPPYSTGKHVYAHIKENLAAWVEEAIKIRNEYK